MTDVTAAGAAAGVAAGAAAPPPKADSKPVENTLWPQIQAALELRKLGKEQAALDVVAKAFASHQQSTAPPTTEPPAQRAFKLVIIAASPDDDLSWIHAAVKETPFIQDRLGPDQANHRETVQAVAGRLTWELIKSTGIVER